MTDALFELPEGAYVPPPEPTELSRGERKKLRIDTRIKAGIHPLGRPVMLREDACRNPDNREDGPRCGGCRFRQLVAYHNRTWPKCWYPDVEGHQHPRDTHCDSSDIRAWWPACKQFEPKEA